jgi:hypothetical protein
MSGTTLQVTLELPEPWGLLTEQERSRLLRAGVYEATRARVRQLQAEIAECEQNIRRFEELYGLPIQRFETERLLALDTWQAHEDYNDWFYWQSVLDEKKSLLAGVQQIKPA